MVSPMQRVSSLVSKDIGNYLTNKQTWKGVIYNVKYYGAEGDGTTDDSSAVTAAINACPSGGMVWFPTDTYRATVTITKPITIMFSGSTIIPPSTSAKIIEATGTASSTTYKLTGSVSRGATSLTVTATVTGISAGDLILLRDDTVRVTDSQANVNEEVHEVLSVAGTTITLKDPVRLPKAVAASDNVKKITPIQGIIIRDVKLQALTGSLINHGIYLDKCRDVTIENVTMTNSAAPCVAIYSCYNVQVYRPNLSAPQSTASGQGYGVAMAYGSSGVTIKDGHFDGMRHSVDCGNSFDVLAENCISTNNANTPYMISHNGWDSDITFRNCKAYGGTSYPFLAASQGVSNLYTLTFYNLRVIDCDAVIDTSSFTVGVYFQSPVKESEVRGTKLTYGTGAVTADGVSGIRLPSVDCGLLIDDCLIKGFKFGVFRDTSGTNPSQTTSDDTARVRVINSKIVNASYAAYNTRVSDVYMENVVIDNIQTTAIQVNNNTQLLRYLTLKNIVLTNYTAGRLIAISGASSSSGVLGEIANLHANTTTNGDLTIIASQALTLENILLNKNGNVVRMNAASPVTMNANPFPTGIIEGQRVTLMSLGSDITIPDGTNNINNGGGNITIGATTRSASFVWSNGAWIQA